MKNYQQQKQNIFVQIHLFEGGLILFHQSKARTQRIQSQCAL